MSVSQRIFGFCGLDRPCQVLDWFYADRGLVGEWMNKILDR